MNDKDILTWEKVHPVLSGFLHGCFACISFMIALLLTSLVVYVMLSMKDERVILEELAKRLGI